MEFLRKIWTKVSVRCCDAWNSIPSPLEYIVNKVLPTPQLKPCRVCYPDGVVTDLDKWAGDLRDWKLERDSYVYDVKLESIKPSQWRMVGRNLLNMAYQDPCYGELAEEEHPAYEDPLPPEVEPSEKVKNMKGPLIYVNTKDMLVDELEALGEFFHEAGENLDLDWDERRAHCKENAHYGEPSGYAPDDSDMEHVEYVTFDPALKLREEVVLQKNINNADVLDGAPPQPWHDDTEDWAARVTGEELPEFPMMRMKEGRLVNTELAARNDGTVPWPPKLIGYDDIPCL